MKGGINGCNVFCEVWRKQMMEFTWKITCQKFDCLTFQMRNSKIPHKHKTRMNKRIFLYFQLTWNLKNEGKFLLIVMKKYFYNCFIILRIRLFLLQCSWTIKSEWISWQRELLSEFSLLIHKDCMLLVIYLKAYYSKDVFLFCSILKQCLNEFLTMVQKLALSRKL